MNNFSKLIAVGLLVLLTTMLAACEQKTDNSKRPATFNDLVPKINQLFVEAQSNSSGLGEGPCLGVVTAPGLANFYVDVVHVPRQEVDNLDENKCLGYTSGQAGSRLVELDFSGNIVLLK
jgi:hypothetical protein